MRRSISVLLVVLSIGGCSVKESKNDEGEVAVATTNEAGAVVWDFRTPLTTVDLGSQFDEVYKLDGPLDLEIIFPSGRTLTGRWARGAFADAEGPGLLPGETPHPVNQVDLIEDEAQDVAAVRASAERFMVEFGPSVSGSDMDSINDYLDEFAAIVASNGGRISPSGHGSGPDGLGSTIRAFDAEQQDGLTVSWLARVVDGGVTLRTVIYFEPASTE